MTEDKTIFSAKHKANISKAKTGSTLSPEHKQKIKESWVRRKARTQKTKIAEGEQK